MCYSSNSEWAFSTGDAGASCGMYQQVCNQQGKRRQVVATNTTHSGYFSSFYCCYYYENTLTYDFLGWFKTIYSHHFGVLLGSKSSIIGLLDPRCCWRESVCERLNEPTKVFLFLLVFFFQQFFVKCSLISFSGSKRLCLVFTLRMLIQIERGAINNERKRIEFGASDGW